MANEFKVRKGLIVQGSGSNIFDVQGSQGQLFSITDSLSGSLFSVNDISGIPIMEVFSDNTIKLGTFNNEAIIVSGSRTGMGIATPQAKLHISGANNDSLLRIQSPASASILFVTGSGNVGIGTNTPKTLLDISSNGGRVRITQNTAGSTFNGIDFINYTGGTDGGLIWNQNTGEIRLNASTSYFPTFYSNNVEAMRITTSGNVGIGETSPSARLEIRGSGATSATTALRVENSNATASLLVRDDGSSTLGFSYANTHIVTGSVSINQSGSNIPLTVNGRNLTSDTGNKIFEVIGSAGTSVFSPRSNGLVYISTGQLYFEQNGLTSRYYDSRLDLGTSIINTASTSANPQLYGGLRVFTWDGSVTNTEVFRVAGTGNVSLGFPSTFTNTARLHISGTTSQQLLEIDAGGNVAPVFVVSGA